MCGSSRRASRYVGRADLEHTDVTLRVRLGTGSQVLTLHDRVLYVTSVTGGKSGITIGSDAATSTGVTGLSILGIALLLGIGGDVLLHGTAWGLNFAVWVATLIAQAAALGRDHTPERSRRGRWLLLLALGFALCLAWRDNTFLLTLDVLAVMAALALPLLRAWDVRMVTARMMDFAAALATTLAHLAFGSLFLLSQDVRWNDLRREETSRRIGGVLAGLLLAVPILIVFGSLFASADPVFGGLVEDLLAWNPFGPTFSHILVAGLLASVAAGFLRSQLLSRRLWAPGAAREPRPSAGIVTLGIALSALILVFVLFVAVQARYLFAGGAYVRVATGLTLAEYARQGFFELVAAAALTVPVLYGAEWLLDSTDPKAVRSFRALGVVQMLLVGLVVLSALQRMRLYTAAYGLTEDRLFGAVFMLWIAFVLVWFGLTVLRGRRERFAFGAVVTGFATLGALNLMNPDGVVVRVNVGRTPAAGRFDGGYLATLSADAVPALVARLASLPAEQRCDVARRLAQRGDRDAVRDWRSWSVARHRAQRALRRLDLVRLRCSGSARASASAG